MIEHVFYLLALAWARLRGRRLGGHIWTWPAGRFWPLDPRPDDVDLLAVARGLSNESRYSGQTRHYYSVAEHSVHVSRCATSLAVSRGYSAAVARACGLVGLLHDASEAYVGDVVRPLKYGRAFAGYRRIEARVQAACEVVLGVASLPTADLAVARAIVHEVDRRILVDENKVLIGGLGSSEEFTRWGPALDVDLMVWAPRQAEKAFLERWDELAAARAAATVSP